MKRTILSLAFIATLSLSSFAQNQNIEKGGKIPHRFQNLNLTENQEKQVKDLSEKYDQNRNALNDQFKNDLKGILTPEQIIALESRENNKSDRNCSNKHKGKNKNNGRKNDLDVVTKQKLDTLRQDYNEKKSSIEKSRVAPDTQKEQLATLKEQYKKDVHGVMNESRKDSIIQRPHSVKAFMDIAPEDK